MKWITAAEIDNWTSRDPRRAQEILPQLVWKLILGSCTRIKDHHFPYGKAIQYSGYDGMLETDGESQFVPLGKSVWEMGTDSDSLSKFNSDYTKRTEKPNGISMEDTTFCFVTSRMWNHKQGIVEATTQKLADGKWNGVRIFDANTLEMWLDYCPAVSAWFAEIIEKPCRDIYELGLYWQRIAKSTEPNLTPEFFTYAREPIAEKIINQFNAGVKQLILVGNSSIEAVLTLAAELSVAEEPSYKNLEARCMVARTQDAFNEINMHYSDAIIIPLFHPKEGYFEEGNNYVLLPVCKFDPLDLICKTGNRIELPSRSRREFCDALEKMGYEANAAYTMGIDLRCNFNALYRRITTNPLAKVPEWSENADAINLIPALLAGSWEESKSGDKAIISTLSGIPYEDYLTTIQQYTVGENAPIFSIEGSYACIAVSDLWDTLWSRITPEAFKRFKECFLAVFSEIDPTYELPEDQWPMASILGKELRHSLQLRKSMIVSLIMLTEREDSNGRCTFSTHISEECTSLVGQVFRSVDSLNHWRTICTNLPAFIEAAPDVVLRTLEDESSKADSPLWELFKATDDFLFGRTFYTHILWALENVMWDRRYAARALNLLILFAEKGFMYKQANCPIETMYRIFCLWHPQGCFTIDERKILIQNIIQNHHSIAPELVGHLLPKGKQTTLGISKPKWRIIESNSKQILRSEYRDILEFTAQTYLQYITPCFADWDIIFSNLASFDPIEPVVEKCSFHIPHMCQDDVYKLCEKLAKYISNRRKFHHQDKAEMQRANVIEKMYFSILPDEPRCYAHYFAYHFDGLNPLPYENGKYDFDAEKRQLSRFQRDKVLEMMDRYGEDSVWRIIPYIENINAYSTVIAEDVIHGKFDWERIKTLRKLNPNIASRVVENLYWKSGLSMLDSESSTPEKSDLGWVLSCVQIKKEIVEYIESLGDPECRRAYWEQVSVWGMDRSDDDWISRCVTMLLEYNRPFTVIDYLSYSDWANTKLILQTLQSALRLYPEAEPNGLTLAHVGQSDIENMFRKLYAQNDVPELEAAKLELAYLRVFDQDFEPKYLVDQVLQQPALYMELLTTAYLPDEGNRDLSTRQKEYAKQADEALDRIQRIPGYCVSSKKMDDAAFAKWITDVNELARSSGYTLANDITVGRILSHAPIGNDGIWPAECVRRLFESAHSETLERNFIIGKQNQRGIHNVTGGAGEDALAEKYAAIADKLQLLYPRTSAIIRRISDGYRYEAKRERARELKSHI